MANAYECCWKLWFSFNNCILPLKRLLWIILQNVMIEVFSSIFYAKMILNVLKEKLVDICMSVGEHDLTTLPSIGTDKLDHTNVNLLLTRTILVKKHNKVMYIKLFLTYPLKTA